MQKFLNENFEYHKAMDLIWLNAALQLMTTLVLVPFNVTIFVEELTNEFAQFCEQTLLKQNITLSEL